MVVISDMLVQAVQMLLVLLLAPLLTGFVRKVKARLVRRQGASVFQPYRDLLRLRCGAIDSNGHAHGLWLGW